MVWGNCSTLSFHPSPLIQSLHSSSWFPSSAAHFYCSSRSPPSVTVAPEPRGSCAKFDVPTAVKAGPPFRDPLPQQQRNLHSPPKLGTHWTSASSTSWPTNEREGRLPPSQPCSVTSALIQPLFCLEGSPSPLAVPRNQRSTGMSSLLFGLDYLPGLL